MKRIAILTVFLFAAFAWGQVSTPPGAILVSSAPSGACVPGPAQFDTANGHLYGCQSLLWVDITSSGGTGTVTSVTFTGDGTVLSSTPSSAVTTSGTVTAALANAAINTVLAGPPSGSPGAPTYQTAPTISAANFTSFPTLNQNTSGTASNLSGTPALPNGITATTQAAADNSTKLATTAFVLANAPLIVAHVDTTGLTASVASATAYAIPAGKAGWYTATCQVVVTTAASSTSTLPICGLLFIDEDTGIQAVVTSAGSTVSNVTGTNTRNVVAAANVGGAFWMHAAQSTNISYNTASYASTGGTAMVYALHVIITYMGP